MQRFFVQCKLKLRIYALESSKLGKEKTVTKQKIQNICHAKQENTFLRVNHQQPTKRQNHVRGVSENICKVLFSACCHSIL